MNEFGRRMRAARHYSGMMQSELSELVGLSQQALSAYESGTRNPTTETAEKIARALGVRAQWLRSEDDDDVRTTIETIEADTPTDTSGIR